MLPINDFIFANPDSANIPIQTVLGLFFLAMFVLAIRYGPSGAIQAMEPFRWVLVVAVALAAIWGIYAYTVLSPPGLWGD